MEQKNRRSIFDCIEEKAKGLLKKGLNVRSVYILVKDDIPVKTGYTGFYNFVLRKKLKNGD